MNRYEWELPALDYELFHLPIALVLTYLERRYGVPQTREELMAYISVFPERDQLQSSLKHRLDSLDAAVPGVLKTEPELDVEEYLLSFCFQ